MSNNSSTINILLTFCNSYAIIIHMEIAKINNKNKKPPYKKIAFAAGTLALSAAIAPNMIDNINGPEFHGSTEYTVQPGDTLFSISKKIPGAEQTNPNAIVYEIASINSLSTSDIYSGQKIAIPKSVEQ